MQIFISNIPLENGFFSNFSYSPSNLILQFFLLIMNWRWEMHAGWWGLTYCIQYCNLTLTWYTAFVLNMIMFIIRIGIFVLTFPLFSIVFLISQNFTLENEFPLIYECIRWLKTGQNLEHLFWTIFLKAKN